MKKRLYKGVEIAEVRVIKYCVKRLDGKVIRTFSSGKAAKAFVDGYAKALEFLRKEQPK